jgi:hypothetical protein
VLGALYVPQLPLKVKIYQPWSYGSMQGPNGSSLSARGSQDTFTCTLGPDRPDSRPPGNHACICPRCPPRGDECQYAWFKVYPTPFNPFLVLTTPVSTHSHPTQSQVIPPGPRTLHPTTVYALFVHPPTQTHTEPCRTAPYTHDPHPKTPHTPRLSVPACPPTQTHTEPSRTAPRPCANGARQQGLNTPFP